MSQSFETDVRAHLSERIAEAPPALDWSDIERRASTHEPPVLQRRRPVSRRLGGSRLMAAAAVIALVLAGGILLLARDNDPDQIKMVPPTSGPTPTTAPIVVTPSTVPATTAVEPEPTLSPSTTTAPASTVAELPIVSAQVHQSPGIEVAAPGDLVVGAASALGAWSDGFIRVAISGGGQVVPQLSEEQKSLFPAEVFDEFGPDGLSGVEVDAAIGALYDAGLLDPVLQVLDANPELRDFIENGGPVAETEFTAAFTLDGTVWEALTVASPPVANVQGLGVVGDRVVAVGRDVSFDGATVVVASTLDLQTWNTQSWDADIDWIAIAMNPSGWIAGRMSDDEQVSFDSMTRAARWKGEPVVVTDVAVPGISSTIAITDGFLRQSESISYSTDGRTWTVLQDAPQGVSLQMSLPLDDGSDAVLTWSNRCESDVFRVSENATQWELIDSDEIPTEVRRRGSLELFASSLSSAAITSNQSAWSWVFEERDMRLTVRECHNRAWYELVNLTTGQTIVSETFEDGRTSGRVSEPLTRLEHLTVRYDDTFPFTLTDPESGNTLLEGNLNDGEIIEQGFGAPEERLIATADGLNWLITDAPDRDSWDIAAARNGDIVLVNVGSLWQRYDLQPSD